MISALFAMTLAFQQGKPTTPIGPPEVKPRVESKVAPPKKKKKAVVAKPKPSLLPGPITLPPQYIDKPGGSGQPVQEGDIVKIHFLVKKQGGVDVADSKKRGLPYTFKIGAPGNDPLLDRVVKGMKPGATRTATVAAKEVYGATGAPPLISGKDTLVVIITLLRRGEK